MDLLTQFRDSAEEANRHRDRRGRRYSSTAKQLAVDYCRKQRGAGHSFSEIAGSLGVNVATLGRWLDIVDEKVQAAELRPRFHPVALTSSSPAPPEDHPASACMVLPSGVRIEGLKLTEVVELARALS